MVRVVADIKDAIDAFLSTNFPDTNITYTYNRPWYPYPKYVSEKDTLYDLGGKTGIYVYSEPDKRNPLVPLGENNNKIWYIGMSENNSIRGRVWSHLNPMRFNKTLSEDIGVQQWGAEDWYSRTSVDLNIRQAIVVGRFVVYGIRIDPFSNYPGYARKLEKHLLHLYKEANGSFPPFNSMG